jgi:TPR repeat protein
VPQDKVQAARLFRQAADQGDAGAQCNLGFCFEKGEGVPQDKAKAARLYRQAAKQGDAGAQCKLGVCYYVGEGVPRDKAQAARLFRQAADQGHTRAQSSLGICYEHGNGVRYDMGEAVALYRLAIAGGYVDANLNLGLCFEKGRGVPLDRAEAERLYQLTAHSGSAHTLTPASIPTLDIAIDGPPHGMAPAVALECIRDAVYDLNLVARLGDSAAAEHLASLAGRRDVTSVCCVGCGASRKLKVCSKCRVARLCDMECTVRMWPAHKASCKAWRNDATSGGKADEPV